LSKFVTKQRDSDKLPIASEAEGVYFHDISSVLIPS
jgi:hypothetical protein